jgi:hypothetical protein
MKNYRVTIRLNVETDTSSTRLVQREIHEWLDEQLTFWAKAEISASVASVTAYEDVLFKDVA